MNDITNFGMNMSAQAASNKGEDSFENYFSQENEFRQKFFLLQFSRRLAHHQRYSNSRLIN